MSRLNLRRGQIRVPRGMDPDGHIGPQVSSIVPRVLDECTGVVGEWQRFPQRSLRFPWFRRQKKKGRPLTQRRLGGAPPLMHGPRFHGAEESRKFLIERLRLYQEGRVSTIWDIVRNAGPLLELELVKKSVVEERIVRAVEDRERGPPCLSNRICRGQSTICSLPSV
jgi:hypothetical protein